MRIAIDISSVTPHRTGIGVYTCELVKRLVQHDHEFVLLFSSLRQPVPEFPEFRRPNVRMLARRIPGPLLLKSWQYFDRPSIEALAGKVDVFHAPATFVPPSRSAPVVTTIHDIFFEGAPRPRQPFGADYLGWVLRHRLRNVDGVICVSEMTRQAMLSSGFVEERQLTEVIPHGIDSQFFERVSRDELARVQKKYRLPASYILHVGGADPRKNLEMLLQEYERLRSQNAIPPLVVLAAADSQPAMPGVQFTPYIEHPDLPAVYRGALMLVYPSLLEGFGMPVLEAIASGVPVIASRNIGALEFLPRNSIKAVDPQRGEELRQAILQVLSDPQSATCSPEFVRALTWEDAAERTLSLYERTLRKHG